MLYVTKYRNVCELIIHFAADQGLLGKMPSSSRVEVNYRVIS